MYQYLYRQLGYTFTTPQLLTMALTHRSFSTDNNERLEFLGDAIVNFVIAEALYQRFPTAPEGDLSRFRASLISREALSKLALSFDLGKYLQLGMGEIKTKGAERSSILSCAMEAIIGAIYLEGGFHTIQQCLLNWYQPLLNELTQAADHKDPKTQLQEYLQQHHLSLPIYSIAVIQGKAHNQEFIVHCQVEGYSEKSEGRGSSRRRAEQSAAAAMLKRIQQK